MNILKFFSRYHIYFFVGVSVTFLTSIVRNVIGQFIIDNTIQGYIYSIVLSYIFGIILSFFSHKIFTFKSKSVISPWQIFLFVSIHVFGMVVTIASSTFLNVFFVNNQLSVNNYEKDLAFFSGAFLASLFTYTLKKRLIFSENDVKY